MKTAQDWQSELEQDPGMASDLVRLFEEIQHDAWKQGMSDAAAIVGNPEATVKFITEAQAILFARDNKTT